MWAIRKTAQSLTDFRAVQLLRPSDKNDVKELQGLFIKLVSLNSVWLSEGAMDVFRNAEDAELTGVENKPSDLKKGFIEIRNQIMTELTHDFAMNADVMGRYSQDMQRFRLNKQLQDNLNRVFQLFGEMSQRTASSSLLTLSGLTSLDTGEEVGAWIKNMQDALASLSKALNEDIESS